MEPYGQGKRGVLVVGEAPGQTEDEEGRPFVGKSGDYLRQFLRSIGVSLDRDALTTNSLICRPPKNATPEDKQIGYCKPNLIKTIEEFSPRVVITLGRSALNSVLRGIWLDKVGTLERWVGWKIPYHKFWICPTYHPSFLMRTKSQMLDRRFSEHLEAAFDIDDDPPERMEIEKMVEVLYDPQEIIRSLDDIDEIGGLAGIDFETNCLKPEYPEAEIVSFAVSNGQRTISYPWSGQDVIEATGRFLHSPKTGKVASNLKMEERWTAKKFGRGVVNWAHDQMLAAHCLDNRKAICSLKFQGFVRLGVETYNEHVDPWLESHKGHYNRIKRIEPKTLMIYNGVDAFLCRKLAFLQRKELQK
jgi:uracil-DNA glycosylase family 4